MRRTTTALLGATVLVALTAACGTGTEPTSAPGNGQATRSDEPAPEEPTEAPGSDDPAEPPPDGPPFPDDTSAQTAENQGDWDLVLADVRVGHHDGFDRLVLEFDGTGTPGWSAQYVDEGVLEGSGDVVALAGDTVLDVHASGTTYPAEGAPQYDGPRQFAPADGDVAEVYVGGTFEGYTQVIAGIDGDPAPFRVFTLSDPARLVVDVRSD